MDRQAVERLEHELRSHTIRSTEQRILRDLCAALLAHSCRFDLMHGEAVGVCGICGKPPGPGVSVSVPLAEGEEPSLRVERHANFTVTCHKCGEVCLKAAPTVGGLPPSSGGGEEECEHQWVPHWNRKGTAEIPCCAKCGIGRGSVSPSVPAGQGGKADKPPVFVEGGTGWRDEDDVISERNMPSPTPSAFREWLGANYEDAEKIYRAIPWPKLPFDTWFAERAWNACEEHHARNR